MATATVLSTAPWRTIGKRLFTSLNPQDPSERTLVIPANSENGAGGWLGVTKPVLSSGADGANEIDLGVRYVYWSLFATFDIRSAIPNGSKINSVTLRWQNEWGRNAQGGVPFYITTRPINGVAAIPDPWWVYNPTGYSDGPYGLFPNPYRVIYDNARVWHSWDISQEEWNHEAIPYWWQSTSFFIALTPLQIHGSVGKEDQYVKLNQNHADGTGSLAPRLVIDYTPPNAAMPNAISVNEFPSHLTLNPYYVLAPPPVSLRPVATFEGDLAVVPVVAYSTYGTVTETFDARLTVEWTVGFDILRIVDFDAKLDVFPAETYGLQHPYPMAITNTCFKFALGGESIVAISGDSEVGVWDLNPIYTLTLNTDIRAFEDQSEVGVSSAPFVLSAQLEEPIDATLFARFESDVSVRGW